MINGLGIKKYPYIDVFTSTNMIASILVTGNS